MRILWGCVALSAMLAASAAQAQTTPVTDEIPAPYASRDDMAVERGPYGPYAALPPAAVYGEEIVPPFQAARILRSTGYELLSRPIRRGPVYMVAVINPRGMEGRAVLDAHTGRLMRFVPVAYDDDSSVDAYGLPGPPPRRMTARPAGRPPAAVPHEASRVPVAAPAAAAPAARPDARPAEAQQQQPPQQQQASPPAGQQQAAAVPPKGTADAASAKPPAPPKPPVQLQPTQPMPPVQDFE